MGTLRDQARVFCAGLLLAATACSTESHTNDGGTAAPDTAMSDGAPPADGADGDSAVDTDTAITDAAAIDAALSDVVPGSDGGGAATFTRKGLCVVADFSDVSLEDWQGAGMRSIGDVEATLRQMEAHWDWLSRGREQMRWDVARVRIPQPLTAQAFPGYLEFRAEVIRLARQIVDPAAYDLDRDGVIDAVWIIPATAGGDYRYMVGGSARAGGANTFVDGQDSGSIVAGAIGNFNHELGHCLGLPDLYGLYGTVEDLSLMASSWPLPPNDFSAFDRVRMGWVVPQVVHGSTTGLVIASANTHLFAVKIPTTRPFEYFLIEYRQHPSSGFGSAAPPYDGLAVYHVLEGSSQQLGTPLVKLEPADGAIVANTAPELRDLLYPGNPAMLTPFEARSYLGGGVVFRLENLAPGPTEDSLRVDVVMGSVSATALPNLLVNPDLEATSAPWTSGGWKPDQAAFSWTDTGHESSHSLSIDARTVPNDVEWNQTVSGLVPGRTYYLCAFVRGESVVGYEDATSGGNVSVSGTFVRSPGGFGTFSWTERCVAFDAELASATVACRLGGFGSVATGTIWCDDLSLIALRPAF